MDGARSTSGRVPGGSSCARELAGEAAGDVENRGGRLVEPPGVFHTLAAGREDRADQRKADLAAVGVAAKSRSIS